MAAKRRARGLAAPVGDHFIDVHVELGAAAGHPNMQGKHIVMLAGENFVAGLNDQFVALIVEPLAIVIGDSSGFLQCRIGRDHLTGNQIFPDTKMFERTLGLSAPEFVGGNFNDAKAVRLFPHLRHGYSPSFYDLIYHLLRQPSMLRRLATFVEESPFTSLDMGSKCNPAPIPWYGTRTRIRNRSG